jgi:2-polyprenyl-3-methyl-5-hydroxy-6-metoxy-1,4-benzoquinol methylase
MYNREAEELFDDVGQETDHKVLAEKYEKHATLVLPNEEPISVHPDGMVFHPSYEFRMLQAYVKQHHDSILDVGCGRGLGMAYWMTKGFSTVWGCDVSETMIEECRKLGLPCREVDLNQPHLLLPYLPNGFDIVISTHVLEHVTNPAVVVKELYRVAKELVMIVVPRGRSYWSKGHINLFNSPEDVVNMLGIEEHWLCSLEEVISKPADVQAGYSCYSLVIYKDKSEE